MTKPFIRINGIAPAWPQLLGQCHPFYPPDETFSMASASYSICGPKRGNSPGWEILIDAGHQTIPFLINHGNRIPDAILLTHGHPDHILGVDWIIQSQRFGQEDAKSFPIYCTDGVWKSLLKSYPHIEPFVVHRKLAPGEKVSIEETNGLMVTAFPVYHGDGGLGAAMLLIEKSQPESAPVLFTGDMLCPLLRKKDYETISKSQMVFIDSNNRFPDPLSNHISFTRYAADIGKESDRLIAWLNHKKITDLIRPHRVQDASMDSYFVEFLSDWNELREIPHTIIDFSMKINISEVYLVHYWGIYDEKFYKQPLLSPALLEKWANKRAGQEGIRNIHFRVPKISQIIYF
jgi:glyoxylase-like metal-dependent hydrolase (beta-lactamase superfamily II)